MNTKCKSQVILLQFKYHHYIFLSISRKLKTDLRFYTKSNLIMLVMQTFVLFYCSLLKKVSIFPCHYAFKN